MKQIIFSLVLCAALGTQAQTVIGSINSGGNSSNNGSYSVGEIFVIPSDANKTNSGTMGILYQLQLLVTGIKQSLVSDDFRAFPNPVTNALYFKLNSENPINEIFVYDMTGKLVFNTIVTANTVDLSTLNTGAYLVKTNIENIEPFKIIKK